MRSPELSPRSDSKLWHSEIALATPRATPGSRASGFCDRKPSNLSSPNEVTPEERYFEPCTGRRNESSL